MRQYSWLVAVSVLAMTITACGAPSQEDEGAAAEAEATAPSEAAQEDEAAAPADGAQETVAEEGASEETAPEQAAAPAVPPAAFTQCQVCHQIAPGQNGIGPSLAGIFGSEAGQVANFSYTQAMRSSGLTWDEATLDSYLANPSAVVPGTTMAVGSLSDEERAAIIDYLKTL